MNTLMPATLVAAGRLLPHRRGAALLAALAVLAACGDVNSPTEPVHPPAAPAGPLQTLDGGTYRSSALITCDVTMADLLIFCSSKQDLGSGTPTIGGVGMHVRLVPSNLAYDAMTQTFTMDVALRNLLVQQIGTPDGPTITGIRPFFTALTRVSGTGTVTVTNADGTDTFTDVNQPYFDYPYKLHTLEFSPTKQWQFNVGTGVTAWRFKIYVSAKVLPVIVFDKEDGGNRDVYRVALDGSDLVRLTNHAASDLDPTSARGRVIYASYRNGNADLYWVPLYGGFQTRITTNAAHQLEPFVNQESSRLVYTDDRTGIPKIWSAKMVPATGVVYADVARTTGLGTAASLEASPMLKPTTVNQIAYVSTQTYGADIYTMQFASPPVSAIAHSAADVEPVYNTTGNRIAFTSNRTGDPEIFIFNPNTLAITQVTTHVGYDGQPTFLEDGRIVYIAEVGGVKQLWWINPTTFVGAQIPTGTGVPRNPSVVPLY
jgi:hypothetical protein